MVTWHFAHERFADCDYWGEPETKWHLDWKSCVPPSMREYVVRRDVLVPDPDAPGGERLDVGIHRADILNGRGMVIELQHSPLKAADVKERELFYENMIWIFDFTEISRHLSFRRQGDHHDYLWKHPRRWMFAARKPVFLDLGRRELFQVKRMSETAPCRGWGNFILKDDFKQIFFV